MAKVFVSFSREAAAQAPCVSLRRELCQSVKDICEGSDKTVARNKLKTIVDRYNNKASKFCGWVKEHFIEGLTYYDFPLEHWRKIRTKNVVERMNQEQKRRTSIGKLFPNISSCQRLVITIPMRIHDEWFLEISI